MQFASNELISFSDSSLCSRTTMVLMLVNLKSRILFLLRDIVEIQSNGLLSAVEILAQLQCVNVGHSVHRLGYGMLKL